MASMPFVLFLYKRIYKSPVKNRYTEFFSNFPKIVMLATKEGFHRRLSELPLFINYIEDMNKTIHILKYIHKN